MNFRFINMLVLCVVLTACASKSKDDKTSAERKAEVFYNQGTRELTAGEYTLALQKLLQANQLTPNDSKICNNLGMAYYFKKDIRSALKFVKKAVKLDPKNVDAKLNLATIYMRENNLNKAEQIYLALLKDLTYLGHNRTHYNLAIIYLLQNQESKAVEHLNKSVEINSNYCPAYFKLGEIAKKRRNYKKALEFYKDASMGVCYDNIKPHIAQVDMMIKLNRYDDARLKLDEMLEKFALTKEESLVKLKIDEVNRKRRLFDSRNREYSQNVDRNFLSTDF